MLFVGVDGHKNTSQITVMDAAGKILKRQRVMTTPEQFRQSLAEFSGPMNAVLEASYCWGPMYDWLGQLTEEVILAHPSKVRAIAEARIKTDKIDSEILAHLLRADLIPKAYAPSKEVRAVKRVLRQRLFLVQLRTMVKNRIRALLTQHSIELPKISDLFSKSGLVWLQQVELHCDRNASGDSSEEFLSTSPIKHWGEPSGRSAGTAGRHIGPKSHPRLPSKPPLMSLGKFSGSQMLSKRGMPLQIGPLKAAKN